MPLWLLVGFLFVLTRGNYRDDIYRAAHGNFPFDILNDVSCYIDVIHPNNKMFFVFV